MVEIPDKEYQALQDAREIAESTLKAVREPLLVLDGDLKVVSASRSFYETFKVQEKDTEKRFIYDLGNKQWDIPKLRHLLESILPKNESFNDYEVEHDFPAIGKRIMLLNARRIPRPPDKPRVILLAIEDITESKQFTGRKRAEEELKESEQKYRALFEGSPDGIIVADVENGQYIDVNPAICRKLGYSEKEIKDLSQFRGIHPKEDNEKVKELFFRQAKGEIDIAEDIPFVKKDGTTRYFDVNSVLMVVDGVKRVVGLLRDVTERRQVEKEIEGSEARYRLLFDSSVDVLVQIDPSGTIVDLNKSAERLSGYKREEVVGRKISALARMFTAPSLALMVANFAKRKLGMQVGPYEVEAIGSAGQRLLFEISAVRLTDSSGEQIGELGILHDITGRKRAEEETAKLNKFMTGREDRVIELKQEINRLLKELGREPKYRA